MLAIAVPFLADVVNLLGAFTITSMCFIFPFAFMLGIFGDRLPRRRRGYLWAVVVLGTMAMMFCTYNAIEKMVSPKGPTPADFAGVTDP